MPVGKDLCFTKCGFRSEKKCFVRGAVLKDAKEVIGKQELKKRAGFMKGPSVRFQALLGLLLFAVLFFNVEQAVSCFNKL
ncbi:hypothetical protein CEXT_54741 [Caerostris extrusa]|uniref:Transmembrane protein n=1 Tax=Caerostris extrusa TaxID=172846 RepID=A0AAV4QUS1_CAEEX|nr:hypothetical protein CEXT_54741 [Caerostris extrusa]